MGRQIQNTVPQPLAFSIWDYNNIFKEQCQICKEAEVQIGSPVSIQGRYPQVWCIVARNLWGMVTLQEETKIIHCEYYVTGIMLMQCQIIQSDHLNKDQISYRKYLDWVLGLAIS